MDTIAVDVVRRDEDGKVVKLDGPVKLDRGNIRTLLLAGAGKKRIDCDTYQADAGSLFSLAESGNASAVHDILESGGKKYIDDLVDDQTPLVAAVGGGHTSVVRELLDTSLPPTARRR